MGPNVIDEVQEYRLDLDDYYLVVLKYSPNFDYSLEPDFLYNFRQKFPGVGIETFWCNYKYAGMLAGLGQIARNSLLYNEKFNFDFHIGVFSIHTEITEWPERKAPNFALLDSCLGCDDCVKACPAQAIHDQERFSWIDAKACDNFAHFNNHEYIPSIKEGWFNSQYDVFSRRITEEEMRSITSFEDFVGMGLNVNTVCYENGRPFAVNYPVCKECTSQKRCSKYGGKYPYSEQKPVKIFWDNYGKGV